uniref:Uncharacterized protein n=1 Tax=Cannabis sativa TaxID=3483 RepID=A0A803QRQ9_CANSA
AGKAFQQVNLPLALVIKEVQYQKIPANVLQTHQIGLLDSVIGKINDNIAVISAKAAAQTLAGAAKGKSKAVGSSKLKTRSLALLASTQLFQQRGKSLLQSKKPPTTLPSLPPFDFAWPIQPTLVSAEVWKKVKEVNACIQDHEQITAQKKAFILSARWKARIVGKAKGTSFGPIIDITTLAIYLMPRVRNDSTPFFAEMTDLTANNICELTPKKWVVASSNDLILLAHTANQQATRAEKLTKKQIEVNAAKLKVNIVKEEYESLLPMLRPGEKGESQKATIKTKNEMEKTMEVALKEVIDAAKIAWRGMGGRFWIGIALSVQEVGAYAGSLLTRGVHVTTIALGMPGDSGRCRVSRWLRTH